MFAELVQVSKNYGQVRALDQITAQISGPIVGLLGPNGAGKSTLLKILLGLTSFSGQSQILGLNPRTESFRIRDLVGYMPEADLHLADMNAVSLCAYAAELSGLPRHEAMQRAHATLYHVGIADKRYQPVDSYSTGLKQRVKLAQALVHDPKLLFLDEPTNGLDPHSRGEILNLIAELPKQRSCSVLLSTNLLPDVEAICDHVVVLTQGSLRFAGPLSELQATTSDPNVFIIRIKGDMSQFCDALRDNHCTLTQSQKELSVHIPHSDPSNLIFTTAQRTGVQIRHLENKKQTLEAAFLALVHNAQAAQDR